MTAAQKPVPLWSPSATRQAASRLEALRLGRGAATYDELWAWSVDPLSQGDFWLEVARDFRVPFDVPPDVALREDVSRVSGVTWFPGATLNYAEMALRGRAGNDRVAVISHDDARGRSALSGDELVDLVGRVQRGLRRYSIGPGDVVAGYLPNIPETLALMLATVGLGATWTCCSPETGVDGVMDRLAQTRPKLFVSVDGYRYGERIRDLRENARVVRSRLSSVTGAVCVSVLDFELDEGWESWSDFVAQSGPVHYEPVDFEHPLYVLYSSGTTGPPKAIVHGHGGITLEHVKALGYHFDVGPDDTFFWFSTTAWMMWNFGVSSLLMGATVVLFDGHPASPEPDRLWSLIAEDAITVAGVGAAFLSSSQKSQLVPGRDHDLSRLTTLGSTGSPLSSDAARWVYHSVKSDVMLSSFSGGTDVCSGFVGPSPLHEVYAGEISCRCLGADVRVLDDEGNEVVGVEGELVLVRPLPSMPVRFLNDPDDLRYRSAYFSQFPNYWTHGDRAVVTPRGTVIITGRSDGTLNRGGVRMGTAEFYGLVESLDQVEDSLVVHLDDDGGPGELWLFLVATEGVDHPSLETLLRESLRTRLSPRHVPDHIVFVDAVPRTLSGKKLEVPVKKILSGSMIDDVVSTSSMLNPESLQPFVELARAISS